MAVHSFGTTLGFGAPPVLFFEVVNISGPNRSVTVSDASHLTVAGAAKAFLPGLIDNGEVTFTVRFFAGQNVTFDTMITGRTTFLFTLTYPTGNTVVFTAFMSAVGDETPEDDTITQDVTLKITGVIAVT